MPLQIVKQLAVEEDIEFGIGSVTQPRDADGDGVAEDIVYTKVSSLSVPHLQLDGSTESDVRTELNDKFSMAEADTRFAALAGNSLQQFNVANPSAPEHAVNEGYLAAYVATNLNSYALKTEVLTKTNLITFSPTSDYHPCTKKYADDLVITAGAGDMVKAVYDNNDSGIVDNSEALSGVALADFNAYKGDFTDADNVLVEGTYECVDGLNVPEAGVGLLRASKLKTSPGYITQMFYSFTSKVYYIRDHNNIEWSPWVTTGDEVIIVDDLLGNNDPLAVLSADQGKVLADQITTISTTNIPVGGVIMFDGYASGIPSNWNICDGSNGTPDLRNRFIRGTSNEGDIGAIGGSDAANMPNHTHTAPDHYHSANHNHSASFGSGSAASAGNHTHDHNTDQSVQAGSGHYGMRFSSGGVQSGLVRSAGSHSHNVSGSVTVNTESMNTGSAGGTNCSYSSASGDNKPAYYTLMYIKRVS